MESEIKDHLPVAADLGSLSAESLHWLDLFFSYLYAERNFSEHTIRAYLKDLLEFLHHLEVEQLKMREVDTQALRSYFTMRTGIDFRSRSQDQRSLTGNSTNRKLSARSQARKLSSLRSFFRFLHRREYLDENPAAGIPAPRHYRSLPGVLKNDELPRILEEEGVPVKEGGLQEILQVRDRALYEMLYSSGMRIAEILSLCISRLPGDLSRLRIEGKGGRERIVFLGPQARQALDEYLRIRPGMNPSSDHLFLNHHGRALGARGVRYRLKCLEQSLQLKSPLSPHKFRHTFATDLMNSGADIRAVQELLGHSRISTTQIYTRVTTERLRDTYRRCHPHSR